MGYHHVPANHKFVTSFAIFSDASALKTRAMFGIRPLWAECATALARSKAITDGGIYYIFNVRVGRHEERAARDVDAGISHCDLKTNKSVFNILARGFARIYIKI